MKLKSRLDRLDRARHSAGRMVLIMRREPQPDVAAQGVLAAWVSQPPHDALHLTPENNETSTEFMDRLCATIGPGFHSIEMTETDFRL